MRCSLWPDEDGEELERELSLMLEFDPPYQVWVAERDGRLIGFIELWVRSYAEGAPAGPAAYIEGIWVEATARRQGVARALLGAAEQWARDAGFRWIGSDALIDNDVSHAWHRAAGFDEIERITIFGKPLD